MDGTSGWALGPDGLWSREFKVRDGAEPPPLPPGYRRVVRWLLPDGTVYRDEQIAPMPELP